MKINNTDQLLNDEDEETIVAPRFDEEETIIAQPVVPLGGAARVQPRPRRPWSFALIIVSVLVGVVIGGAGFYMFQTRTSASNAAHASAPEPVNVAAQPAQPAPTAPTAEAQSETTTPAPSGNAENAQVAENPPDGSGAKNDKAEGKKSEADKKDAEASSVSERRSGSNEGERDVAPKHERKGETDDNSRAAQRDVRPRRTEVDTQAPIPDDSSHAAARARRVEEGLRRAERIRERRRGRRENASRSPDSIQGIFEGQPQ
jgi:type IV secretory pathway VirB10-like protein